MSFRLIAIAASALLALFFVMQDAFEVMLLPRRISRRFRFTRVFFRAGWASWAWLARRNAAGAKRERFLSVFGPLSMIVLFALWAACLIVCFGTLEWVLQATDQHASAWSEQVYMSGVTFFTLGYGDVVPHMGWARALAVIEAGTGIGFIAVVIGYLPVLYQLFARREAHVIQLDARAGTPPSAATLLCRHADGALGKLDELLREWERWGADLLESHLSYPMLVYYRSQHDNQSWLAAIAAVMDTCALILVGVDELHPLQARMTFGMARQVIVEMARSFDVQPSRFDGGDRLPQESYERLVAMIGQTGLAWNTAAQTRETLAALRATYEPLLDGLARRLLLTIPDWLPAGDAIDNWQAGHRGMIASRLVAQLSERSATAPGEKKLGWRLLKRRLRQPGQ